MSTKVLNLGCKKGETLFKRTACKPEKHSLWWKPKVCSDKGEGAFYQEIFLVPDWSSLMQMRNPYLHGLIGANSTVLIGQFLEF